MGHRSTLAELHLPQRPWTPSPRLSRNLAHTTHTKFFYASVKFVASIIQYNYSIDPFKKFYLIPDKIFYFPRYSIAFLFKTYLSFCRACYLLSLCELILKKLMLTFGINPVARVDHHKLFLATISKPHMEFMVTWQPYRWPCKKINIAQKALKTPIQCTLSGEPYKNHIWTM